MSADNTHYKIEGLVTINKRGQFVLPKELRSKASINANDKMAIITYQDAEGSTLLLMKTENLAVAYNPK